jgi:hypothetical protein
MATIRLCDWTKKVIGKEVKTHKLILDGKEYEISNEALDELKSRLDGDTVSVVKPVRATQPSPRVAEPVDDIGVNVEAPSPFGGKVEPGLLDNAPVAQNPSVQPITIPASIKDRLPMPTPAQADAVVAESTRFREGTLSALTPGKQRNIAQQRLAAKEATFEDNKKPVPDIGRRGE